MNITVILRMRRGRGGPPPPPGTERNVRKLTSYVEQERDYK
jgi:hypothetical protein